jgi:hypothetical protein
MGSVAMAAKGQLVSEYLEKISGDILQDYPDVIRSYVKGKHGIYALYRRNRLYYVGQASNLRMRLGQHLKDRHAGKWDRFSIYITTTADHMRDLESLIIRIASPQENRVRGGFVATENLRERLRQDIEAYFSKRISSWIDGETPHLPNRDKRKNQDKLPNKEDRTARDLGGLLKRNQTLRAIHKGKTFLAKVRANGRISLNAKFFDSPSGAGNYVTKRSTDGWHFWRYRNDEGKWRPIDELRKNGKADRSRKPGKTDTGHRIDTIVCPSTEEGFQETFMGQHCWDAIRLNEKRIPFINYIAVYRKHPVSAITHYASVQSIKPYKNTDKFIVRFKCKPRKLRPVPLDTSRTKDRLVPPGPFFTSMKRIKAAKTLNEL